MKINLLAMKVPTGTHEAELLDVSLFTARDGLQFLKLRFEVFCKSRNFRMDKNFPDPGNNPYFSELIADLGVRLEKGTILETEDLKGFSYNVTVTEDKNGRRYIQAVVPALEEEDFDDEEEVEYDGEEAEDVEYDDEEIDFGEDE